MGYQFPDEIQSQVNGFKASAQITSLVDEISILRMLLNQPSTQQNPRLAMDLIGSIGKLSKLIDQQHERESLVIHRDRLAELASQLIEVVVKHISDIPGYESRVDQIVEEYSLFLVDQPKQVD